MGSSKRGPLSNISALTSVCFQNDVPQLSQILTSASKAEPCSSRSWGHTEFLFFSPFTSLSVAHWRPWIPVQLSTVCLPCGCTGRFHKGRQWLYFSSTLAFFLLNSLQRLLAMAFTLRRQFALFKRPFLLSFKNSVV